MWSSLETYLVKAKALPWTRRVKFPNSQLLYVFQAGDFFFLFLVKAGEGGDDEKQGLRSK